MQKEAKERDPVLRADWFRKLARWKAEQMVFIDESGINSKLGRPKYGYAPKGVKIRYPVKSGKAENLSLLPAFTIDGYLACNVYKGGVTKAGLVFGRENIEIRSVQTRIYRASVASIQAPSGFYFGSIGQELAQLSMSGRFEHVKRYIVRRIESIELEMIFMYRSRPDQMNVSCRDSFPA